MSISSNQKASLIPLWGFNYGRKPEVLLTAFFWKLWQSTCLLLIPLGVVGEGGRQGIAWANDSSVVKPFISFAAIKHGQFARDPHVFGFAVRGTVVDTFLDHQDSWLRTRYRPHAQQVSAGFATEAYQISDSQKLHWHKIIGKGRYLGRVQLNDQVDLLLDARLRIAALQREDGRGIHLQSIVADRVKPAADSRGEPLQTEIASLRARMRRAFEQLDRRRILTTGILKPPPEIELGDEAQYLLVTRIPDFPLVTLQCSESSLASCMIARRCQLTGTRSIDTDYYTGIAFSSQRQLLLLGDSRLGRLFAYRFHSCFHVEFIAIAHLPRELGPLTSIWVDEEDQLWVSTARRDDFHNASLYVFHADGW